MNIFTQLPPDIFWLICKLLDSKSCIGLVKVARYFNKILHNQDLWCHFAHYELDCPKIIFKSYFFKCRTPVDLFKRFSFCFANIEDADVSFFYSRFCSKPVIPGSRCCREHLPFLDSVNTSLCALCGLRARTNQNTKLCLRCFESGRFEKEACKYVEPWRTAGERVIHCSKPVISGTSYCQEHKK